MSRRIIISGGGTAGSISPLLGVVDELRRRDPTINWLLVGTAAGPERDLAEIAGLPFHSIPAGKWRRYWSWKNFSDLGSLWQGFRAARQIVASWRPDTIVTAGSYVSVPLVWAGKLAGSKILIHQQDVRPGLANRLMAPAADVITVTFEQSLRHFPAAKVRYTGNPVRADILRGDPVEGRRLFQLQSGLPTLLVLGGSTGSSFLNHLVSAVAYRLVNDWQIVHLTGRDRDFVELQDERYHRYDFLTWEMPHAMAVANVVVSRVGLGTLTELAALGKPCLFVPMPGTHQEDNAQLLAQLKAGLVVDQDQLNPATFHEQLERLRKNAVERRVFGDNLHQLYRPDAVEQIGQVILQLRPQ
ncbi:MAG: UDP-N-acetylglucosamine--N-acetylmuramyl-(pentapeptide) pyrophosphoryl-undecaprenol N-acetylglucosamine transferase [Candidatus Kerfeldbacteria bacterium]|nr:UDP-N-acetylglucosamine--N-acetylmuramyl-(pentapeptide) pyrophosphoryl-undecaprenol N-acetylglucosamine transferase [Candidatus Kerfeldbacteria bacterium]